MQAVMTARQHSTPPTLEIDEFFDLSCTAGSASSVSTNLDHEWSPQSALTAASTPPGRSPVRFKECGPQLLPRVRVQDQVMPTAPAVSRPITHIRTQSMPIVNGYAYQYSAMPVQYAGQTPTDVYYPAAHAYGSAPRAVTCETISPQHLTTPVTAARGHSRTVSTSSIDASLVNKYRYPTYRQSPTPQPPGLTCTPDALSHLAPMSMLGGSSRATYQPQSRGLSPHAQMSMATKLPLSLPDAQQTCLKTYLTKPNPAPKTLEQPMVDRMNQDSCWWDVRNVYEWSDFNIETILSIEGFYNLIHCSVDSISLPEPGRVNLAPETRAQLAELCSAHHLFKLNRALALSQGTKHLAARALTASATSHKQPEFISNYCSAADGTIYGNGKGRVVGIARGFEEWNSGMRGNSPIKRIEYLRGLSALHKQMRDHGCRYGFIISEIELVCVRAGGQAPFGQPPLFGFLELSAPISLSTHGSEKDGRLRMTAGIALWYLHMLARDTPLPGQLDWRLNVGAPSAGTRQHHLKKDSWIPQPNQSEKRTAKRTRGWFMPDEPVSSIERGKGGRRRNA